MARCRCCPPGWRKVFNLRFDDLRFTIFPKSYFVNRQIVNKIIRVICGERCYLCIDIKKKGMTYGSNDLDPRTATLAETLLVRQQRSLRTRDTRSADPPFPSEARPRVRPPLGRGHTRPATPWRTAERRPSSEVFQSGSHQIRWNDAQYLTFLDFYSPQRRTEAHRG